MFKVVLISVVIVPVILGMQAGSTRRAHQGLLLLLIFLLVYDVLYLMLLYYLRVRWLG